MSKDTQQQVSKDTQQRMSRDAQTGASRDTRTDAPNGAGHGGRRGFLKPLILIVALVCAAIALAACNTAEAGAKVTFMVSEGGVWSVYKTADVSDGAVAMPDDPARDYYVFRGWYEDEAFGDGSAFQNKDIKKSKTVYARLVAETVRVWLDGESQGEKTLADVMGGVYAPSRENLVLDAWYTDEAYEVKYYTGDDATALYARFMAQVVFDNGHELLWTTLATPNAVMDEPSGADIVKWYMSESENDRYYTDENGDEIDFDEYIVEQNQTITVMWNSPFWKYAENGTGNLTVSSYDTGIAINGTIWYYMIGQAPAVSVLSRVVYNGTTRTVDSVYQGPSGTSVATILIGEGIKSITNSFSGNHPVQKISLPSTLEIIDTSFNGIVSLPSVTLPANLKVLINSFHGAYKTSPIGIDIEIPASVIGLAQTPSNLKFSSNDKFYRDADGRIFKYDERGDILISDYNIVNGTLTVPETAAGIQVGAFAELDISMLVLPASWSYINFNANQADYPAYYVSTSISYGNLWDGDYRDDPISHTGVNAYSVYGTLQNDIAIYIEQAAYPAEVPAYAFTGRYMPGGSTIGSSIQPYTHSAFSDKVRFIGAVEPGEQAAVRLYIDNPTTGESVISNTTFTSGGTLTEDDLLGWVLNAIGLAEFAAVVELASVKQFGEAYIYTVVATNLYINVEWGYSAEITGFTYTDNGDGTVTVTGFDRETAFFLESDNMYLIQIPETVDGKTVTAIAADAFNDNQLISHILIPNTVTSIGARAFKDTANLVKVLIAPGGLESIGESAFEGTGLTDIALPVGNLTYVGPYAFKSRTLQTFTVAAGEEDRRLYTVATGRVTVPNPDLKAGDYFIADLKLVNGAYRGWQLIRYTGTSVEQQNASSTSTEQVNITVFDIQLIAICAGRVATTGAGLWTSTVYFQVGSSGRRSSSSSNPLDSVVRYELMTGSVYYLDSSATVGGQGSYTGIAFGIVSKIHVNAFTDIGARAKSAIYYYKASNASMSDEWIDLADIRNLNSDIFDDGWFEGYMPNDEDYEANMKFITGKNPTLYSLFFN